ncbi:MAG: hypothetical protein RBR35_07270 [Salinivirgaceae bacterium]|nr:hypothetical protein [Salinivirgaceae bacterium]
MVFNGYFNKITTIFNRLWLCNMSYLRQKSEFNLDAAKLLQSNSLFAPSVHCSYYSCLQLLKATIIEFFGVSYEELDIALINAQQKTRLTHTNTLSKE